MALSRKRNYNKSDRLRQLRAFCHVAETRSITRAADQLHVSQPAVSQHVRGLEFELEVSLFDRAGPRIALSRAGERLYRIAKPLVQAIDRLPELVTEESAHPISGQLRIAAGPGAVAYVLPRYIKRFRDEHPNVRVTVNTCGVNDAMKLVSANEVDLAVGAEAFGPKDFDYYPAFSYGLVLITPTDHPLAARESVDLREVAAWPAVVPHSGTYARQFGEAIARRYGVEVNVAVEARGWGVITSYVEAGLGVSIIPDVCLREGDRVSVVPLGDYTDRQSFGFFARPGRPLSPAADRFIREIDPELLLPRPPSASSASG